MAERNAEASKIGLNTRTAPGGGVRVTDPGMSTGPSARVSNDFRTDNYELAQSMAASRGMFVLPIQTLRNGKTIYGLSSVDPADLGVRARDRAARYQYPRTWTGPITRVPHYDKSVVDTSDTARFQYPRTWSQDQNLTQSPDRRANNGKSLKAPESDTNIAVNEEARRRRREVAELSMRQAAQRWENLGIPGAYETGMKLISEGYTQKQAGVMLVERMKSTAEYKSLYGDIQDARREAGLSPLNPGDIMDMRNRYRDVLRQAGMPPGFYDDPSDFNDFLKNDVSPTEIANRAAMANRVVGESVAPEVQEAFRKYYGIRRGDLAAYFLDPDRAQPLLEKQAQAALIGSEALNADMGVGRGFAEELVGKGVTQGAARSAFQETAATEDTLGTLAGLDGVDLSRKDIVRSNLDLSPDAARKVKGLASRERARFGGSADATRAFGTGGNSY